MKQRTWTWIFFFVLVLGAAGLACDDAPAETPVVSTQTPEGGAAADDTGADSGESAGEEAPAAEADSDEAAAAPEAYLGDIVESDGTSLAAVALLDPAPAGILYEPAPDTRLIAVDVVVGNVNKNSGVSVNSLDFVLLDEEGFTYSAELFGLDRQLETVDLMPGERVRGLVGFEIPTEAVPSRVRFEPGFISGPQLVTYVTTPDGGTEAAPPADVSASGAVERDVFGVLGDVAEANGVTLAAFNVEDPATPTGFYDAPAGTKLVAVEIAVGNTDNDSLSVNPLNTYLVTTDGYVYGAELGARDGQIDTVEIGPEERARGWVAFTIPEDQTPEQIKYSASFFGSEFVAVGVR